MSEEFKPNKLKMVRRVKGGMMNFSDVDLPVRRTQPTTEQLLGKDITNLQTRLQAVGVQPEAYDQKANLLMKALGVLDAPRDLLWKALGAPVDETGRTSGTALINQFFGQQDFTAQPLSGQAVQDVQNLAKYGGSVREARGGGTNIQTGARQNLEASARGMGALVTEAVTDPLNYVTLGLGGLAKGALTGTAKSMTEETAQAVAKASLGATPSKEAIEQATRQHFWDLANEAVPSVTLEGYKKGASEKLLTTLTRLKGKTPEELAIDLMERLGPDSQFAKLPDDQMMKLAEDIATITRSKALLRTQKASALMQLSPDLKNMARKEMEAMRTAVREAKLAEFHKKLPEDGALKGKTEALYGLGLAKKEAPEVVGGAIEEAIKRVNMAEAGAVDYATEYDSLVKSLSEHFLKENDVIKRMDKGLSVVGQTIIPGWKMQDAGAKMANKLVEKLPFLRNSTDAVAHVFRTKFLGGELQPGADAFFSAQAITKGAYNVALNQAMHTYNELESVFKAMPDGDAQKKFIGRLIENDLQVPEDLVGTVRPETLGVAERIRNDFRNMLEAEKSLGLKKGTVYDKLYMARMMSEETFQKLGKEFNTSNVTSRMGITDPTKSRTYRTDFDTAQVFRNIDTSSPQSRGAIADLLETYRDSAPQGDELAKMISDKALTALRNGKAGDMLPLNPEVIKAFKNDILEVADGIKAFYEEDGVKAYLSRLLQHERLIANSKERDAFLDVFGVETRDINEINRALDDKTKKVIIKYMPNIYSLTPTEIAEATTGRGLGGKSALSSLQEKNIQNYGTMIDLNPSEFKALATASGKTPVVTIMPAKAFDHYKRTMSRQLDEGMSTIGNLMDTFNRLWKPLATSMRPDYYLRNYLGSSMQSYLGGGVRAWNPKHASIGNTLVTGQHANKTVQLGGKEVDLGQLHTMAQREHIYQTMHRDDVGDVYRQITGQPVVVDYGKEAVRKGKAKRGGVTEKVMTGASKVQKGAEKIEQAGRDLSNALEDRVRAQFFVAQVERGLKAGLDLSGASKYAGEQVRKFHFDYSDLTYTERKLLQRIMPFYTWSRKNIPLQLEMLLNDPAKYNNMMRSVRVSQEAFGQEENATYLPEYARDDLTLATPFASDSGNPIFMTGLFPASDLKRTAVGPVGAFKDVFGMLSPVLKEPTEQVFGREALTGMPITKGDGTDSETQMRLEHAMRAFIPQARTFGNIASDTRGVLSPWQENEMARKWSLELGGSVAKQLNVDKGKEAQLYEYLRQLKNQRQSVEEQLGIEIPTLDEIKRMQQGR